MSLLLFSLLVNLPSSTWPQDSNMIFLYFKYCIFCIKNVWHAIFLNSPKDRATCVQRIHQPTACFDSISQRRKKVAYWISGEATNILVLHGSFRLWTMISVLNNALNLYVGIYWRPSSSNSHNKELHEICKGKLLFFCIKEYLGVRDDKKFKG